MKIKLVKVSRSNSYYKEIRDRHYVKNSGCIGKQIHYLIFNEEQMRPIGVISGASAVWACRSRDKFFKIDKDNRVDKIDQIINNVVFRLEADGKNLASHILSLWRRTILKDWTKKYHSRVIGFETFVYGKQRKGGIYRADNWTYVGVTAGSAKVKHHGAYGIGEREKTERKLIFCRMKKGAKAKGKET